MVKVYAADTAPLFQETCFCERYEKVGKGRKEKIDQCIRQKDKIRSLAAGILLQCAWEEFNLQKKGEDIIQNDLIVQYGKEGKPLCGNNPDFYFNLSHSGTYAVCAVSQKEVGVDIQKSKGFHLKVAERFFTQNEQKKIMEAAEEDRNRIFNEIWTFKESYIKYTGKGMQQGLSTFYKDEERGIVIDQTGRETVFVHQYDMIREYHITVCSQEEEFMEQLLMRTL